MMRWFRAFLPKEERFFDLFDRHAQTINQGAITLQGMLNGGEETPVYAITFELYENGISRALSLDYNEFVVTGKLTSLEIKAPKPCP